MMAKLDIYRLLRIAVVMQLLIIDLNMQPRE